eukprot:4912581-Pyramimonas_sp.AAC.1
MCIRDRLETLFEEYSRLSGLHLHLGKSVIIPLSPGELEDSRQAIAQVTTAWAAMRVASDTEYLGFVLGPTSGRKS